MSNFKGSTCLQTVTSYSYIIYIVYISNIKNVMYNVNKLIVFEALNVKK